MCRVFIVLATVCAIAYGAQLRRILAKNEYRIQNGENAEIEEFPYMLLMTDNDDNVHCGASIISAKWALTAVHCTYRWKPKDFKLYAGISNTEYLKNHTGLQVRKIINHPKYNDTEFDYNYALLKVFPSRQKRHAAIKLANSEPKTGQIAVTTGWGRLSCYGESPKQLQKVSVPIVDNDTCDKKYTYKITERMLCAGPEDSIKGVRCGDSGGPLVVNGVQVGITSWGYKCGILGYPDIYASVANQLNWIRKISGI